VGNRNNGKARRIEMTDRLIDRARSPIHGVRLKKEEQQTFKSKRIGTYQDTHSDTKVFVMQKNKRKKSVFFCRSNRFDVPFWA